MRMLWATVGDPLPPCFTRPVLFATQCRLQTHSTFKPHLFSTGHLSYRTPPDPKISSDVVFRFCKTLGTVMDDLYCNSELSGCNFWSQQPDSVPDARAQSTAHGISGPSRSHHAAFSQITAGVHTNPLLSGTSSVLWNCSSEPCDYQMYLTNIAKN